MASYLRPRRGSFVNAKSQLTASNPLKSGEVFFECENIGHSQGKIKLGDATTTYSSLPYFLSMQDSSCGFTDSTGSNSTADSTLLNSTNMGPSSAHSTVLTNMKQLLWNHSSKIAALINSLSNKLDKSGGAVTGNIYPNTSANYSIGTNSNWFNYVYSYGVKCVNAYAGTTDDTNNDSLVNIKFFNTKMPKRLWLGSVNAAAVINLDVSAENYQYILVRYKITGSAYNYTAIVGKNNSFYLEAISNSAQYPLSIYNRYILIEDTKFTTNTGRCMRYDGVQDFDAIEIVELIGIINS